MERLAGALGSYLASQAGAGKEQEEILTYGALILLLHGSTVVLTVLLASLAGLLPYVLVIIVVWAAVRHATGGAHFTSPYACLIATTSTFLAAAAAAAWLVETAMVSPLSAGAAAAGTALFSTFLVFRHAPVEAPSRPLRPAHLRRMKYLGRWLAAAVTMLVVVGAWYTWWWAFPISIAYLLQSLSLTPTGQRIAGPSNSGDPISQEDSQTFNGREVK